MDIDARTLLLSRPVTPLWRAPGILQLDAEAGVVFEHVPGDVARALKLLATPQTFASLHRLLPALDGIWIDWLIAELFGAGLLGPGRRPPSSGVTLIGSGTLATDMAAALGGAGFGPVRRLSSGLGSGPAGDPILHWSRFTGPWTQLVIVATHTAEPDRMLTQHLMRQGTDHLVVRAGAARAVVGPFVIPGASACVRCHDLVRCQFDSAWPVLLAQLCRVSPEPPAHVRNWAASTALMQVRARAMGATPDTLGRTLEISWDDPAIRAQTIPLHPECGCSAA